MTFFLQHSVDNNRIVDAVFFDFSKAFDTVPHDVLISRLHLHGIHGNLLAWISDFLQNRTQKVRVGASFSESLQVTSGVIQGSVLGPTLFNIFVNHIDQSLEFCNILKYADDLRIFSSSSKSPSHLLELQSRMQRDINNIAAWAASNGMSFNVKKCFFTSFNDIGNSRSYTIDGSNIEFKACFRDLGLTVSSPLSFNAHVDSVVAKAYRRLGLISKVFRIKSPTTTLKLYKAFVRPILDFSSVIWNPHTNRNIAKIERVQRRMCRCLPHIRSASYRSQLSIIGTHSLEARRLRYQLIILFKMYKSLVNVNINDFFPFVQNKRTRGHTATISAKFAKNNYRRDFFTVSVINFWNKLPQSAIDASSVAEFKSCIKSFFIDQSIW